MQIKPRIYFDENDNPEQMGFKDMILLRPSDILDVRSEQPEFALKDWLPLPFGACTMFSSPGGSGKTLTILQLAVRFVLENPGKKAFLWFSEDKKEYTRGRLDVICQFLNVHPSRIRGRIFIYDREPIQLLVKSDGRHILGPEFNAIISELHEYGLVVFDPLIAFYGGDENSNSQARVFMQGFMNWAMHGNKIIVFIHHAGKKDSEGNRNARGASAFIDAVRMQYSMDWMYKQVKGKRTSTKDNHQTHLRMFRLEKDNYGAIQYLKNFTAVRQILPKSTLWDTPEIENPKPDIGGAQ